MKNNKPSISERIRHVRIKEGYCLLCGEYGTLTKDHVPPKSAITLTPMLQRTVSEWWSTDSVKPLSAVSGTVFKTLCKRCNNEVLGKKDKYISDVCKEISLSLQSYIQNINSISNIIKVPLNSINFTRAMIGHIIAASSVEQCQKELIETPFYTPLRDYVLGNNDTFEDTHDIYYWFYPKRAQITAQSVGFFNDGHLCICSVLHFFPISFLITFKGEGTFPAQANRLKLSDKHLYLNLSMNNLDYVSFPFSPLKGNNLMLYTSGYTCVSYPAKL